MVNGHADAINAGGRAALPKEESSSLFGFSVNFVVGGAKYLFIFIAICAPLSSLYEYHTFCHSFPDVVRMLQAN